MVKKIFFIIILGIIIISLSANSSAQIAEGEALDILITDVKVENNKLISAATIFSKVKTKIASTFSQNVLNEDIKNLYATGYFTDISVDLKDYEGGVAVTFIVTEKPLLKELIFKGNEEIRTQRLKSLIETEMGQPLDSAKLKQDIEKIRKYYIKEGYHLVLVGEEVLIDEETNEAKVFIVVDEGGRYRIKTIKVTGNEVISDKEILKSIKTRRDTLLTSGFFDEKVFKTDIERIKRLYADRGYSDTQISYDLNYNKEKKNIIINIEIEEGQKYIVGKIEIKGNKVISQEEMRDSLGMQEGATFVPINLEKDLADINEMYFERGYIFAKVTPDVVFNKKLQQMDITYNIKENEQAYIEKIEIRGNTKTKDIVIRRELAISPGDVFDGKKLRKSKQNLNKLGYFEEITYDTEPGTSAEKKNLIINVKEAKTGEVSFGAGYSSIDKFIGFVQLSQRNFDYKNFPTVTGDGQEISLRAEFGSERRLYDLSFTEPWLFDRPVSFGFDIYSRYRTRVNYDLENLGGDLRLGKRFGETVSLDGMYKLEKVKIGDIPSYASDDVWNEEGENIISSLSFLLLRDTRNNIFNPTSGGTIENSLQVSGGFLGGDRDFIKYSAALNWYFTYFEKFTFEVRLRGGIVDEYDDTIMVPIYERFFAGGGNTIRGYEERRVGPKSIAGDPIGGRTTLIANIEYTFPVIKNIKGAVFYDVGNVWSKIGDFGDDFKSSVGLGVRVKTPLGPVKVDYGYGLDYEPGEEKGRFHFSMSRGF